MRYTPVELRHVRVGRSLFGYKRHDIDKLLEDVADSFEEVWSERGELADKVEELGEGPRRRQAARGATRCDARLRRAGRGRRARAGEEGGGADRRRGPPGGAVGHARRPGRARPALRRGAPRRDAAPRCARDGRGDEGRAAAASDEAGASGGVAQARGHAGVPGAIRPEDVAAQAGRARGRRPAERRGAEAAARAARGGCARRTTTTPAGPRGFSWG